MYVSHYMYVCLYTLFMPVYVKNELRLKMKRGGTDQSNYN